MTTARLMFTSAANWNSPLASRRAISEPTCAGWRGKEAWVGWGVGSVEAEGKQGYESWRRAWPWPLQPGSWLQRVT